jgi:5-methylcytosine-specific restriction protein B
MSETWSEYLGASSHDLPEDVASASDVMIQPPPQPTPPADLGALAEQLLLDDELWLEEVTELLEDRKQLVLYGPPGTGKTFIAREIGRFLTEDDGDLEVVQFHPSYTYEQFVEGYRPVVREDGEMFYELRPGPLVELAERAAENRDRRFVLLIDEVNRGNLPKIFGELLYLLEYRGEAVRLMYRRADKPFVLPPNLYFLGTMNTADRSIGVIDAALRRRFHFRGLFPNRLPIAATLDKWIATHSPDLAWLPDVVKRLNERLVATDHQLQVGHSYFMREDLTEERVDLIWRADVLPFLEDQLFGRENVADTFALARIRGEVAPPEPPAPVMKADDMAGPEGLNDADDSPQGA